MTTNTLVVYNNGTPSETDKTAISTYIDTLVANGDTNGTYIKTQDATTYSITRTWIDTNAADAWVTYITAYNPVSAEVVLG